MGSLFERFSRNPTPTTRIGAGFPPFPSTGSFSPPSPPRDEPRRSGESGAMAAPFIYCRSSIEGNSTVSTLPSPSPSISSTDLERGAISDGDLSFSRALCVCVLQPKTLSSRLPSTETSPASKVITSQPYSLLFTASIH